MDLKNIEGIKNEEIIQLSKNWITTAEQFASICLNKTGSKGLQTLLMVSDTRYKEIVEVILNSLSQVQIDEIKQFKNYQNKTGTKKPLR